VSDLRSSAPISADLASNLLEAVAL